MKRIMLIFMSATLFSCSTHKRLLTITNESSIDRVDEIVEIEITDADKYAVYTKKGEALQCQTTYKGNLIFPATVSAVSTTDYILRKGKRVEIDTLATGKIYPQWYDDFAWENDKIAFRTYSTKLSDAGSNFYGYDIFTKRYKLPVLDILYGATFDKEYGRIIAKLRENNEDQAANYLQYNLSYHNDHGLGMDYYTVGPTLGSGTAAIRLNDNIIYPGCYLKSEILDKGGLRISFRLTYNPINIDGEMVQEERIITLDRGTHFNEIEVFYKNLTKPQEIVVGLVIHDECKDKLLGDGFIAYAEPKHKYGWQTYNAVICPNELKNEIVHFDKPIGSARGHMLSVSQYKPNAMFRYYMGAGWNRWGFKTPQLWFDHVNTQVEKIKTPLTYKLR